MTRAGIRYSNIEPDQDTSAAPSPTGVIGRPRWNQCDVGRATVGDRDEAREPRFGGEEIVCARIETAVRDAIADREDLACRVEEEAKLHRIEELLRDAGDGGEALDERRDAAAARSSCPMSSWTCSTRSSPTDPTRRLPSSMAVSSLTAVWHRSASAARVGDEEQRALLAIAASRAAGWRPATTASRWEAHGMSRSRSRQWLAMVARAACAQTRTSESSPSPRSAVNVRAMSTSASAWPAS